jgi:hypothetical protein
MTGASESRYLELHICVLPLLPPFFLLPCAGADEAACAAVEATRREIRSRAHDVKFRRAIFVELVRDDWQRLPSTLGSGITVTSPGYKP